MDIHGLSVSFITNFRVTQGGGVVCVFLLRSCGIYNLQAHAFGPQALQAFKGSEVQTAVRNDTHDGLQKGQTYKGWPRQWIHFNLFNLDPEMNIKTYLGVV